VSLNRYAKRRDATEPVIVKELRQCGFLVRRQDFPDLSIRAPSWPPGAAQLIELDGITKNRVRSEKQKQFLQEWSIPTARTTEEVLNVLLRFDTSNRVISARCTSVSVRSTATS